MKQGFPSPQEQAPRMIPSAELDPILMMTEEVTEVGASIDLAGRTDSPFNVLASGKTVRFSGEDHDGGKQTLVIVDNIAVRYSGPKDPGAEGKYTAQRFSDEEIATFAERPLTVGARSHRLGFKLQSAAAVTGGGLSSAPTQSKRMLSNAMKIANQMNSQG